MGKNYLGEIGGAASLANPIAGIALGGIGALMGGSDGSSDQLYALKDKLPKDMQLAFDWMQYNYDQGHDAEASQRLPGNDPKRNTPPPSTKITTKRGLDFYKAFDTQGTKGALNWLKNNMSVIGKSPIPLKKQEAQDFNEKSYSLVAGTGTNNKQQNSNQNSISPTVSIAQTNVSDPAISSLPNNIAPGMTQWKAETKAVTDKASQKEQQLWDDYLKFEKLYFTGAGNTFDKYNKNISSIPSLSLTMPASMGGATTPMAPSHNASVYGAESKNVMNMLNNAMQAKQSGITPELNIIKNEQSTGLTQAENNFLPTQTALELYKQKMIDDAALARANSSIPESKSAWSTWAPVVGNLLQPGQGGESLLGTAVTKTGGWLDNWLNSNNSFSNTESGLSSIPDWSNSFGNDAAGLAASLITNF